jgi:hypothetical protein
MDRLTSCCAALLMATKRIDGRLAASQIASASLASFLLAFDVWPYEPGRDQPHLVTELFDLVCPIVRARASLHRHQARREVRDEAQQLPPRELLAHTGFPFASQP